MHGFNCKIQIYINTVFAEWKKPLAASNYRRRQTEVTYCVLLESQGNCWFKILFRFSIERPLMEKLQRGLPQINVFGYKWESDVTTLADGH